MSLGPFTKPSQTHWFTPHPNWSAELSLLAQLTSIQLQQAFTVIVFRTAPLHSAGIAPLPLEQHIYLVSIYPNTIKNHYNRPCNAGAAICKVIAYTDRHAYSHMPSIQRDLCKIAMATVNSVPSFKYQLETMAKINKPLGEEIPDTFLVNRRASHSSKVHHFMYCEDKMLIT